MSENNSCSSAGSCGKSSCEGCPSKAAPNERNMAFMEEANPNSRVKHVIGVVSGKGGVGKSFVTSTLAGQMARLGYKVGILDADITGPSIPKMFGVHGPAVGDENGTFPVEAEDGTKIMSINLLLEDEEAPVIWRGPVIAGAVQQFWTDVIWGDVDVMFVDMPPGTGDVPLTVFQSLPIDGIIVVTSPQELVGMIVSKAVKMADRMNIPILGLVENMSYFMCPNCNEKHEIFGRSRVDEIASAYGIGSTARLPIDPVIARHVDVGAIEDLNVDFLDDLYMEIMG